MAERIKLKSGYYGSGLVLLSAFLFGSYGVWSRLIGNSMDNFFQGWTRAGIILLVLLPWAAYRREIIKIKSADLTWLAVFLVCTSLTVAPIFYAFNHMDVGSASLLFFMAQFLTMSLFGLWFLDECFTAAKWISLLMAIGGIYLVFSFSVGHFPLLPALMAVTNGVASGGEIASSKKLSHAYSPLYLIILSWAIILITNGAISIALGERQLAPELSSPWLWQLCYSLASLFAFWLVIAGMHYIDAGIGALIGLTEIVFSVVFAIFLFGEALRLSVAFGAILIIGAAALPHLSTVRARALRINRE